MSGIITDNSARSTGLIKPVSVSGGGKVLQSVTGSTTSVINTSNASFSDSGLCVAITCAATDSKVLVMMHTTMLQGSNSQFAYFTIERQISGGSNTNLGNGTYGLISSRGDAAYIGPATMIYLDSPSTTSEVNYEVQARGTPTYGIHYLGGKAIVTATEIGA